ncbi:hypothetical protein GH722_19370 [Alphaproteobacteria bacterium HT1-32]|nr:hypothetical protein [Alphaproteobacteria bacterium HT1-32]
MQRALNIEACKVNEHCVGLRWEVSDADYLARIISVIAMGQAVHAAQIIADLSPAAPAINDEALREYAKLRLSIKGDTKNAQKASRWHRDGLIFEAISWVAARQLADGEVLLKDPHISATTQGLDGFMIELDEKGTTITRATIFEDKCSEDPRRMFRDEILPAFAVYHRNKRASELVAAAATLISTKLTGTAATQAAARVLDLQFRAYRAGLAIEACSDSENGRAALFKGYEKLDKITDKQRIGATFVTTAELRDWFDEMAELAIAYIDGLAKDGA